MRSEELPDAVSGFEWCSGCAGKPLPCLVCALRLADYARVLGERYPRVP